MEPIKFNFTSQNKFPNDIYPTGNHNIFRTKVENKNRITIYHFMNAHPIAARLKTGNMFDDHLVIERTSKISTTVVLMNNGSKEIMNGEILLYFPKRLS